jgi:alpha-beta hydrolase superfamily lysophospholipase
MQAPEQQTFTFVADDGHELFVRRFVPESATPARGIVHVAHGMAEHGGRYARLAASLTRAGYVVYANDHRGHGQTAKNEDDLGFFASSGGFRRAVRDLEQLIAKEKADHAGLGLVLLGHSMGSYLTQAVMIERGSELAGAVLSGTSGKPSALAAAGRAVARVERLRLGERGRSKLLDDLSFGRFNAPFEPSRTKFDWLSRDADEVDKYVADPRCGFTCTTSLWVDLLDALEEIASPDRHRQIPKGLPIYVLSGVDDPVGERTRSVWQLLEAYRTAGLTRVTSRFYPGRHEMFNETNRDEVERDLIDWLDGIFPAGTDRQHPRP